MDIDPLRQIRGRRTLEQDNNVEALSTSCGSVNGSRKQSSHGPARRCDLGRLAGKSGAGDAGAEEGGSVGFVFGIFLGPLKAAEMLWLGLRLADPRSKWKLQQTEGLRAETDGRKRSCRVSGKR